MNFGRALTLIEISHGNNNLHEGNEVCETFTIGKYNTLKVDRESPHGYFLNNQSNESVLLPYALTTERFALDDIITVFLYADSQDRLIATKQRPYAQRDEFAYLKIVGLSKFGIFCDIGLDKELLIPRKLQPKQFAIADKILVRVTKDPFENRLIADTHYKEYLDSPVGQLSTYQHVMLLPFKKTDLGYKVIINQKFEGLLFHNEIFQPIVLGATIQGYVKEVRNDGKVSVTLNAPKSQQLFIDKERIIQTLQAHHSMLEVSSKSSPQEIEALFLMSKKAFKRALNSLLLENRAVIKNEKLYLVD